MVSLARLCRNVLFAVYLAIITPPFSLVALAIFWLPAKFRYHTIGQWNRCVLLGARIICGIRHEVKGIENLPPPPYVICSKHQSTWETISFYQLFPPNCFVAKRTLLLLPFFGWGLYLAMQPIPIDRTTPIEALKQVVRLGKKRLAAGWNVVIFPEGTRIDPKNTKPFLPSASFLAVSAKVPLVPVAHNSGLCWPRAHLGFDKKPGLITLSIGKPIATEKRKSRDVNAEAEAWINSETKRLGG